MSIKDKLKPVQSVGPMPCRCGGKFYATTEDYAVTHTLPLCPQFEELDPIAFMQWTRLGDA